jgi:Nucleotide exchange factor Fes1
MYRFVVSFLSFLYFLSEKPSMQSLLRWGIEHSANDDSTTGVVPLTQRTDLDPGVIDVILGRPDSELMKEALAKAQDPSLYEDARLTALDDLEMVKQSFFVYPLSTELAFFSGSSFGVS